MQNTNCKNNDRLLLAAKLMGHMVCTPGGRAQLQYRAKQKLKIKKNTKMQNVKSPTSKLSVKCCKIDRIHFLCVHLAVNIMQVIKLQTHRVVSYICNLQGNSQCQGKRSTNCLKNLQGHITANATFCDTLISLDRRNFSHALVIIWSISSTPHKAAEIISFAAQPSH